MKLAADRLPSRLDPKNPDGAVVLEMDLQGTSTHASTQGAVAGDGAWETAGSHRLPRDTPSAPLRAVCQSPTVMVMLSVAVPVSLVVVIGDFHRDRMLTLGHLGKGALKSLLIRAI